MRSVNERGIKQRHIMDGELTFNYCTKAESFHDKARLLTFGDYPFRVADTFFHTEQKELQV